MKKIITLTLCLLLVFSLCACGVKSDRVNYKKGLKDYVTLPELQGVKFTESDETYKQFYEQYLKNDLERFSQKLESGTVEKGDIANINYKGMVNGVAFTGGTAENFNLTIGSNKFIDGFEEQLIGQKIGETKTITVTFPEGYGNSTDIETQKIVIELSGKEAQFEVKINSITRAATELTEANLKELGYDTKEDYLKEVHIGTIKNCYYSYLMEKTIIEEYPPESDGTLYEYFKGYYTNYAQQNGASFESFLSGNNLTEEKFREEVLAESLVMYACFDELKLKLGENAINEEYDRICKELGVSLEIAKEQYPIEVVESQLVTLAVLNQLYEGI